MRSAPWQTAYTRSTQLERHGAARIAHAVSGRDVFGFPVWQMGDEVHLARLDGKAGRREAGRVEHRGHTVCEDLTIRNGIPVTSGTAVGGIDACRHRARPRDGQRSTPYQGDLHRRRRIESMACDPHTLNAPVVLGLADGR